MEQLWILAGICAGFSFFFSGIGATIAHYLRDRVNDRRLSICEDSIASLDAKINNRLSQQSRTVKSERTQALIQELGTLVMGNDADKNGKIGALVMGNLDVLQDLMKRM